jgi:hypothetical protein
MLSIDCLEKVIYTKIANPDLFMLVYVSYNYGSGKN